MGYRIHVAKVRKIEYSTGYFSHEIEQINEILFNFCPSSYFSGSADHETCDHIEVYSPEFKKFLLKVENNEEWFKDWLKDNNIDLEYKDLLRAFREWNAFYDHDNDWIYLDWF